MNLIWPEFNMNLIWPQLYTDLVLVPTTLLSCQCQYRQHYSVVRLLQLKKTQKESVILQTLLPAHFTPVHLSFLPLTSNGPVRLFLCVASLFAIDRFFRTCFLILCNEPSHDLNGASVWTFRIPNTGTMCKLLWVHDQRGVSPDVIGCAIKV